jgi:hypothetical protein
VGVSSSKEMGEGSASRARTRPGATQATLARPAQAARRHNQDDQHNQHEPTTSARLEARAARVASRDELSSNSVQRVVRHLVLRKRLHDRFFLRLKLVHEWHGIHRI